MDRDTIVAAVQEARRSGAPFDRSLLGAHTTGLLVEPENLTASVPSGYPLAQLQAELAQFGLFYPPAHHLQGALSLGSHLASGRSGPWRLGRGTARDWVLGLEVVTGTGDVIQTGGNVVKNVAGLDLTKLLIGSGGRLGMITRATLRLAPLPEATALVAARFATPAQALTPLAPLLASQLAPGALELTGAVLIVGLEGTPADLPRRVATAQEALQQAGGTLIDHPALPVAPLPGAGALVRAGFPAGVAQGWVEALPPGTPLQGHAGSGIYWAALPGEGALLTKLADLAESLQGYISVERSDHPLPPGLARRAPGLAIIEERLRQVFDPDGVFREGGMTDGA